MDADRHPEEKKSRPGCRIAVAVVAALLVLCGLGVALVGYSIWTSPAVQAGVRAVGPAMEMTRAGMVAPGAQALRDAGCRQALVYSPEMMERFVEQLALEGLEAPAVPFLVCAVHASPPGAATDAGGPPDCDALARTHADAVPLAPPEVIVTVFVAGRGPPHCAAAFDRDGARVRDLTEAEARFGAVVRPRAF